MMYTKYNIKKYQVGLLVGLAMQLNQEDQDMSEDISEFFQTITGDDHTAIYNGSMKGFLALILIMYHKEFHDLLREWLAGNILLTRSELVEELYKIAGKKE